MDAIRKEVSALTLLAEVLCLLDMIVNSFANMISTKPVDRYTRPRFTGRWLMFFASFCSIVSICWNKASIILFVDNGPLAIDAGRHPILESVHNEFIVGHILLSLNTMSQEMKGLFSTRNFIDSFIHNLKCWCYVWFLYCHFFCSPTIYFFLKHQTLSLSWGQTCKI